MPLMQLNRALSFIFLFLFFFSIHACGLSSLRGFQRNGPPQRPVIIDTDLAFDDRLAILYVFKRPEISVKAITVWVHDEEDCSQKIQELQTLLALTKYETVPLACGSIPGVEKKATSQRALSLLTSVLQSSSQKTSILALGPLTNLAEAFRKVPDLINRIEEIFIMGGAVHVPGNVLKSDKGINTPLAEWNIYANPEAANLVLRSRVPITLIPLDATNQVPITEAFIERLKTVHSNSQTAYVLNLLTAQHKPPAGPIFFWDPLAAAIFCDQTLARFEKKHLRVVEEEGPARGQVVIDPAGPEVCVAFRVDRDRFERIFLESLAPLSLGHSD